METEKLNYLKENPLTFLDIETTGLRYDHEITEIGGLVVSQPDYREINEFDFKIKPRHLEKADPVALQITGYNDANWENAIDLKTALAQLESLARNTILIGQNFTFDWARLEKAFFENGWTDIPPAFCYHRLDVMSMAFAKLYKEPKLKHYSLRDLADYFGVTNKCQHSALEDARTTYEVFKKIMSF
ncbi:MAG TPA: 3'-5' exonuclease [Candidatus Paceibacterota bacterium]|nr:3'-5' exonuclease [Candidatus Paceibacterota bacterium]